MRIAIIFALLLLLPAFQVRAGRVVLDNGSVRLEFDSQIGRIVFFGTSGGRNLLWVQPEEETASQKAEKTWINWGGDKVWVAIQPQWPSIYGREWPPVDRIEGFPWQIIQSDKTSLLARSPESEQVGVVLEREITLPATGTSVTIVNRLQRVRDVKIPVHIWPVTQVVLPEFILLDVTRMQEDGEPWGRMFGPVEKGDFEYLDRALLFRQKAEEGRKIAVSGAWAAAVYPDIVFLQSGRDYPDALYLDRGPLHVFAMDAYTELELLSPTVQLEKAGVLQHEVTWHLLEREDEDPAALVGRVREVFIPETQP